MRISVPLMNRRFPGILALGVSLVSAHSVIVGCLLVLVPTRLLGLFGWTIDCHPFFLQQAGVFHILLGMFYAIELFAYSSVRILLITKIGAVVFLTIQYVIAVREPAVLLANAIDGAMAVLIGILWFLPKPTTNALPPAA